MAPFAVVVTLDPESQIEVVCLSAQASHWPHCLRWSGFSGQPPSLTSEAGHRPSVTARKDDAPAAGQAAVNNLAGSGSISVGGGLSQTTSG
jgi:hypothetical protein